MARAVTRNPLLPSRESKDNVQSALPPVVLSKNRADLVCYKGWEIVHRDLPFSILLDIKLAILPQIFLHYVRNSPFWLKDQLDLLAHPFLHRWRRQLHRGHAGVRGGGDIFR